MALHVTTHIYLRGQVPTQDNSTLHQLADLLCNDLGHHNEKFSEANPITDAQEDQIESERAVNGGVCSECLAYAEAILGQIRLEVA